MAMGGLENGGGLDLLLSGERVLATPRRESVLPSTRGLKVSDLAGLVYPYLTFSEVTKSIAVEFLMPWAQNPWGAAGG
ncbi:hypothetical protein [Microvirga makkahensis]|uniref:Uncharacterized protein n=1 Tax=Microvirga makkahensis TaxID=1128670 RepID=A0A7X3MQZ6_9HYPH|nr:hypothetical protein [Microvirga makkahensis]MXQ11637.1 hypothetical protein [Microvirga makkahensis]